RYAPLEGLITYPAAPDFVARFLLSVFDVARSLTGSAGFAIILMTLFVRGGMMPLSIRNQLSMRRQGRKMARIKPKLEQLKERYGHPLVDWAIPPGGIRSINLLPLLYMGLSIWQQRLMPKALDDQQRQQMKMAKWMSIIFPILLYNYTAALALYMCVSSTVAI